MSEYLDVVKNRLRAKRLGAKQGWHPEGFVFCDQLYRNDGSVEPVIPHPAFQRIGSAAVWANLTNNEQSVQERLTLLLAFAAPLVRFTGCGGFTVAPYGLTDKPHLQWMLSAWGDPQQLIVPYGEDRFNLINTYARHNSLPIVFDGAGDMALTDIARLSNEFYRGRAKASTPGAEQSQTRAKNWSSILILPAQECITDRVKKLTISNRIFTAVFDYPLTTYWPYTGVRQVYADHHGSAGAQYAQYISQRALAIADHVQVARELAWKRLSVRPDFGHFAALVACISVAGVMAKRCGVIQFEIAPVIEYAFMRCREIFQTISTKRNTRAEKLSKARQKKSRKKVRALTKKASA